MVPLPLAVGLTAALGGLIWALVAPEAATGGWITMSTGLALLAYDLWRAGVVQLLWRATMATLANIFLLAPFIILLGGVGSVLAWQSGAIGLELFTKPSSGQQAQLLASELTKLVVLTLWGVAVGPVLDAATIYCWRRRDQERTLRGAINYTILRFRRMWGPHAVSFGAISLGMSVIIPGVMFGLWWAWVDAIAATRDKTLDPLLKRLGRDPEARSVLQWSRVLSRGHRSRIMRAWLPYTLWYVPAAMYLVYQAEGSGFAAVLLFGSANMVLLTVMEMVMVGLFEERLEALAAQAEAQGITGVEEPEAPSAEEIPEAGPGGDAWKKYKG